MGTRYAAPCHALDRMKVTAGITEPATGAERLINVRHILRPLHGPYTGPGQGPHG